MRIVDVLQPFRDSTSVLLCRRTLQHQSLRLKIFRHVSSVCYRSRPWLGAMAFGGNGVICGVGHTGSESFEIKWKSFSPCSFVSFTLQDVFRTSLLKVLGYTQSLQTWRSGLRVYDQAVICICIAEAQVISEVYGQRDASDVSYHRRQFPQFCVKIPDFGLFLPASCVKYPCILNRMIFGYFMLTVLRLGSENAGGRIV